MPFPKPLFRNSKTPLTGRFFIGVLFLISSSNCLASEPLPKSCVSNHFDEKAEVNYIIDGDTVVLQDGRHVRLIGINTPELARGNKPAEQGAELARQALMTLIKDSEPIYLRHGNETHDRHGRNLAHLYLDNGIYIQAQLLKLGLAMPLRVPPEPRPGELLS